MNDPAAFARVGLVLPVVLERRVKVLPCVCGGTVRADVRSPEAGVRSHNSSKRHRAYRAGLIEWLES